MYHYVRELPETPYPNIKGLLLSQFREQLAYLERFYHFVTMEECIAAVYEDAPLPRNAALLTFDDAYRDHYEKVFPLLLEKGVQGSFFPPAKAIEEHEVLDVNKIHFVLAVTKDIDALVRRVYALLDRHRDTYGLESYESYYSRLAKPSRFDTAQVVFVKRLLQAALPPEARKEIVGELFAECVTSDENGFSQELYMSPEELKEMVRSGMFVGSHGYGHLWLDTLTPQEQEREVDSALDFLARLGAPSRSWVMCYPYGAYNASLVGTLKKKGCRLALSTKVDIASLSEENAFSLERLDTNDLPKSGIAPPNEWTLKVQEIMRRSIPGRCGRRLS